MSEDLTPETTTEQPLADRGSNRSQRPGSAGVRPVHHVRLGRAARRRRRERSPAADRTAARRSALSAQFPGERLVIPAGTFKVRSNDTDYRFRPHSAFAHLTGLGSEQEPDAVLVLHPVEDGAGDDGSGHHAVLYIRPLAGRDTEEFFSDARYGEFWVGARPTLEDLETLTGIRTAHVDDLRDALAKDVGADGVQVRVVPDVDEAIEELRRGDPRDRGGRRARRELAEALSELRLVKDAYEIEQMRLAVDATIDGLREDRPRARPGRRAPRAASASSRARSSATPAQEGNAVGYETIAASGEHAHDAALDATTTARCAPGELVLVDAGVEVDSLYTADITRTLPVDGTFTEVQRRIYEAVLDAADAAFAAAVPGRQVPRRARRRDAGHRRAARASGGCCRSRAEEALLPENQHHRRWMVHGTSHHLGLDVHDCAQARARALPRRRPRARHGVHHRARPVLQVRRPAGARGVPRHRRAHRGRRAGHRGRQREPVRGAPPRRPTRSRRGWRDCSTAECRSGRPVRVTPVQGTSPTQEADMDPNLALLFSRAATIRLVHSGMPDGPQVDPAPTVRERLRARSAARLEARVCPGWSEGGPLGGAGGAGGARRRHGRRPPRLGARSRRVRSRRIRRAGGGDRRRRAGRPAGLDAADLAQQLARLVRLLRPAQHRVGRRDDLAGRREVALPAGERVREDREQQAEGATDEDRGHQRALGARAS